MKEEKITKIKHRMEKWLDNGDWKIYKAIRYTPLSGGKLLRSSIILNIGKDLGIDDEDLLDLCVAVEFFHSGTLIHDDLPAIDDASFRRGKKANHKVFGENIAILAGDGLFFKSFIIISEKYPKLVFDFSKVAYDVLVGEAIDVELEEKQVYTEKDIYEMYRKKTGALFGFSFMAAARLKERRFWRKLKEIGESFGIAFQIYDDIKDIKGEFEKVGKDLGKDINKKTILKLKSIKQAEYEANEIYKKVIDNLVFYGLNRTADFLKSVQNMVKEG